VGVIDAKLAKTPSNSKTNMKYQASFIQSPLNSSYLSALKAGNNNAFCTSTHAAIRARHPKSITTLAKTPAPLQRNLHLEMR
jgi:hypothetical protein